MATAAKLVVLSEPLRGQSFPLAQDEFTIGRSEDCNLCIPDPTISGKHCTLDRQEGGSYEIRDHNSTNGSRVNGMRVQAQKLAHGDILQLGGVELLFECGEKSSTAVLSTQTQINLSASSGRSPVSEMSNFSPWGSRSGFAPGRRSWSRLLGMGLLALLGVAALVVLVMIIMMLVK